MEFFVHYMQAPIGCVKGYNQYGRIIDGYPIGYDLREALAKYRDSKGFMSNITSGEPKHIYFRYQKPEVMQKIIDKYHFPEAALTVIEASGMLGSIYRVASNVFMLSPVPIEGYQFTELFITRNHTCPAIS